MLISFRSSMHKKQQLIFVFLSFQHEDVLPFFWCSLAGHLDHVWSMDAGIQLVHPALASLCLHQCASLSENHLFVREMNKETKKGTLTSDYRQTMRKEENLWRNHLHMLSCRTKLAMLLCLKNFGRISFANLCSSNTRKLFPSYKEK